LCSNSEFVDCRDQKKVKKELGIFQLSKFLQNSSVQLYTITEFFRESRKDWIINNKNETEQLSFYDALF